MRALRQQILRAETQIIRISETEPAFLKTKSKDQDGRVHLIMEVRPPRHTAPKQTFVKSEGSHLDHIRAVMVHERNRRR